MDSYRSFGGKWVKTLNKLGYLYILGFRGQPPYQLSYN